MKKIFLFQKSCWCLSMETPVKETKIQHLQNDFLHSQDLYRFLE